MPTIIQQSPPKMRSIKHPLPWSEIDTVLLDMDGTLLDLHFDWHFWMTFIPQKYAEKTGLSLEQAQSYIEEKIHSQTGTLNWYCLDYWQAQLNLPIAELKRELKHLIQTHPEVIAFLSQLRKLNKHIVMVTNAHRDSLSLKLEMTEIGDYFDCILSSHDYGIPKENTAIWQKIHQTYPFDPARTLLIDDNLTALRSAKEFGVGHLLAAIHVSPQLEKVDPAEFDYFENFNQIMP